MNANEVIANLAGDGAHPNDHVNMGQSSNDVFPSAVHLAALGEVTSDLLPGDRGPRGGVRREGRGVRRPRQVRAHPPDGRRPGHARPGVRRLRGADAARRRADPRHPRRASARSRSGGTATGTGINTHREFAERVRARLAEATGLEISAPEDPFEANGNRDALVELSGALKVLAVSLIKIAGDLALMGSGPRAGLAEIRLPEFQKGSSIMPGKVNPVILRGHDPGRRPGDRQRRRDHARRLAGPVRAQRPGAADRPQPPRLDQAARLDLPPARREVRERDRGERGDARRATPSRRCRSRRPSPRTSATTRRPRSSRRPRTRTAPCARSRTERGVDDAVLDEALDFVSMARPHD